MTISILDLTLDQAAAVEEQTGYPIDTWQDAPKVKLFRTILAVSEGQPEDSYADLSLGELLERVTFSEPKGEAEGEPA